MSWSSTNQGCGSTIGRISSRRSLSAIRWVEYRASCYAGSDDLCQVCALDTNTADIFMLLLEQPVANPLVASNLFPPSQIRLRGQRATASSPSSPPSHTERRCLNLSPSARSGLLIRLYNSLPYTVRHAPLPSRGLARCSQRGFSKRQLCDEPGYNMAWLVTVLPGELGVI
jgi:hypothetical protein